MHSIKFGPRKITQSVGLEMPMRLGKGICGPTRSAVDPTFNDKAGIDEF